MCLGRFELPRGAICRLYLDAQLDRDSASVAVETKKSIPLSVNKLASHLKRLCLPHLVRQLNECPETGGARLELEFADYLAGCGAPQRCSQGDERTADNGVSMGTICPQSDIDKLYYYKL